MGVFSSRVLKGHERLERHGTGRALRALVALAVAVVLGGCTNAANVASGSSNSEGVSAHQIVVGGIAAVTGPLAAEFSPIFDGVQAYFDSVNAKGGVDGRKLVYSAKLDDATDPAQDTADARKLVEQYHVFAVVGVSTPTFAGAGYLAANKIPTFGYVINSQWFGQPTFFGQEGSYYNLASPGPEVSYLAHKVHARSVAVLAYSQTQSQQCAQGFVNSFHKFGIHVGLVDESIPFGVTSLSTDVQRMKQDGINFVATCMDLSGNTLLSTGLRQAGMTNVKQYWPTGYSEAALHSYASLMNGVYFFSAAVPFEAPALYPGRYPGMERFLAVMHHYYPNELPNQVALAGWLNAQLFVKGLRAVGRHLTRSALVRAINKMTHWTGGGLLAPVDWKVAHDHGGPLDCNAFIQVRNGHFVPVFGTPPSVFRCFPYPQPKPPTLKAIPLPAGVPGA
ncbi:MAG: ABC transporter substrate-binding protein [Acidimicrobiales bacterium]